MALAAFLAALRDDLWRFTNTAYDMPSARRQYYSRILIFMLYFSILSWYVELGHFALLKFSRFMITLLSGCKGTIFRQEATVNTKYNNIISFG